MSSIGGESSTPFTDMVREVLAVKGATLRSVAERAVDPETGKKLQHTTLAKIAKGESYRHDRWIVGAIAAATRRPLVEVKQAAAAEWVGLTADDILGMSTPEVSVVVAYKPGTRPEDLPLVKQALKNLDLEDAKITFVEDGHAGS
ncbi:hypothetical protein AB0N09_31670 [Streptomyces erythrochromogenes]|uniref:hypothetical protein n=1 Tax=Streptomyces erythrochromogenes TaxID=285574 RepID=UPI00343B3C8B